MTPKRQNLSIMTLNAWCGTAFDPLICFIKEQAYAIDVLCFQEVYSNQLGVFPHRLSGRTNLYQELEVALAESHLGFFWPVLSGLGNGTGSWGQAMFVRHGLMFTDYGSRLVHGHPKGHVPHEGKTIPRNLAYVTLATPTGDTTIATWHGLWNGEGKTDTPERISQSRSLVSILRELPGRLILCGDFNLLPGTESLRIISLGLRDLISQFGITNTRSEKHYAKSVRYADYIFTEPAIDVRACAVIPAHEISDHLPLVIEITY